MSLKLRLDEQGVTGVDDVLVNAIESVAGPLIVASYGAPLLMVPTPTSLPAFPPTPLAGLLTGPVTQSIISQTGAESCPAVSYLMLALESDVQTLIHTVLLAGATSVNIRPVPGPPAPPAPISPIMLITSTIPGIPSDLGARKFANALLQWAVDLMPLIDFRIAGRLTVIPV